MTNKQLEKLIAEVKPYQFRDWLDTLAADHNIYTGSHERCVFAQFFAYIAKQTVGDTILACWDGVYLRGLGGRPPIFKFKGWLAKLNALIMTSPYLLGKLQLEAMFHSAFPRSPKQIVKEFTAQRFTDWLKRQSADRSFRYSDNRRCVFASFLREAFDGSNDIRVRPFAYRIDDLTFEFITPIQELEKELIGAINSSIDGKLYVRDIRKLWKEVLKNANR